MQLVSNTFFKYCTTSTRIFDQINQKKDFMQLTLATASENLAVLEHSFCSLIRVYMTMIFTYFQSEMRMLLGKLQKMLDSHNEEIVSKVCTINSLLHLCFSNKESEKQSDGLRPPEPNIYLSNFLNFAESDKIFISRISADSEETHSIENLKIDLDFLATHHS